MEPLDLSNYESLIVQYAPIIILAACYFRRNNIFVTPATLSKTLTDMREDIDKKLEEKYATKELVNELKDDIKEIKSQLNMLSSYLMNQK